MAKSNEIEEYLSLVESRLKSNGYKVNYNVKIKDYACKVIASNREFKLEFGGFIDTYYIFHQFETLDFLSFKQFSSTCLKYVIKHKIIPLKYTPLYNVNCFPVAIVSSITDSVVKSIQNEDPPKHVGSMEMPVVYNYQSQRIYFSEQTPLWGGLYWDYIREIISYMLNPDHIDFGSSPE